MTVKFDMAKAYDIVECVLLESMMERLGFNIQEMNFLIVGLNFNCLLLMHSCNGEPKSFIRHLRGLR